MLRLKVKSKSVMVLPIDTPAPLSTSVAATATAGNSVKTPQAVLCHQKPQKRLWTWWGVIKNTEPGAQFDDYFERQDLGQVIYFGIDSMDPAVKSQIEALRDSGKRVHLYGTFLSNVSDYNGSQIQVDRIEIEE